jgi:hypothetical protein
MLHNPFLRSYDETVIQKQQVDLQKFHSILQNLGETK